MNVFFVLLLVLLASLCMRMNPNPLRECLWAQQQASDHRQRVIHSSTSQMRVLLLTDMGTSQAIDPKRHAHETVYATAGHDHGQKDNTSAHRFATHSLVKMILTSTMCCAYALFHILIFYEISSCHHIMHTLAPVKTFDHCCQELFTRLERCTITILRNVSIIWAAKKLFWVKLVFFFADFFFRTFGGRCLWKFCSWAFLLMVCRLRIFGFVRVLNFLVLIGFGLSSILFSFLFCRWRETEPKSSSRRAKTLRPHYLHHALTRPHTRPTTHTTPLHPTTLHSHLFVCRPHPCTS